ncbi:MAG: LacI family transcriptional regulator [Clostridiales bacterium]|nr:LacI family transcriptional regulator [Clostridiales bacterium]
MATIRDVAARAGVSVSTVSIVLNGQQEVRSIPAETVQRVQNAMEALSYRPSRAAQALRGKAGPPPVALCWVLDGRSTFFMRVARGAAEAATDENHPLELTVLPFENGKMDQLIRRLRNPAVHGALVGCTTAEDQRQLEEADLGKPVVFLNRVSLRFPFCTSDIEDIGRLTREYALRQGSRRLGFVTDARAMVPKTTRREAIRAACAAASISCLPEHVLLTENSVSGGYDAAGQLLSLVKPPDLVFCDNEVLAVGVSAGLRAAGFHSIRILAAGLGLSDLGRHMEPAIDLIDIPGEAIGREGAKLLSLLLRGKETESCCICESRLILSDPRE